MTEGEHRLIPASPEALEKRYWRPHDFGDDCTWQSVSTRNPILPIRMTEFLDEFARATLIDHLVEDPEPAFALKPKQTFNAQLAESGTVIEFEREEFRMIKENKWGNPYTQETLFGVVCDYPAGNRVRKVIIPYVYFDRTGDLDSKALENPIIEVGKSYHERIGTKTRHSYESLIKIKSLKVY